MRDIVLGALYRLNLGGGLLFKAERMTGDGLSVYLFNGAKMRVVLPLGLVRDHCTPIRFKA